MGPPIGCVVVLIVVGIVVAARERQPVFALAILAALIAMGVARSFIRMRSRLTANEKQRRAFMADIAHELRTPLAVLQGRIEGMLDGVYERNDARLGEVLQQTAMLSRLIDDLRTLANAERGALELKKETVDIAQLLGETAASVDDAIEVDAAEELPAIEADPLRLREVLINLYTNAIRHRTSRIAVAARGESNRLQITVADDGPGIAPQDLPNIFERFYKGSSSTGSGLGLAIAREIVRAHGGEIRAESIAGRGTTMVVTLPY